MSAKRTAKRRNFSWDITEEAYFDLIVMVCHYCGGELYKSGVGLDRKDNVKGYEMSNVVPCCGRCNVTRGNRFTYEEMLLLAKVIREIDSTRTKSRV